MASDFSLCDAETALTATLQGNHRFLPHFQAKAPSASGQRPLQQVGMGAGAEPRQAGSEVKDLWEVVPGLGETKQDPFHHPPSRPRTDSGLEFELCKAVDGGRRQWWRLWQG